MALRAGAGIAVILAAVLIFQFIRHDKRRADIMTVAAQSPAAAAEMIARRFGNPEAVCHPVDPADDVENLVSALFAIERFGIAPFETAIETLVARLSAAIGLRPPDFTYGPGQIRLSRALLLVYATETADTRARLSGQVPTHEIEDLPTTGRVALALLNACPARRVARLLFEAALDRPFEKAGSDQILARNQIMRVATIYNAQAAPADGKAALAHHVFNQIVYHLTVHYRYTHKPHPTASWTTRR